MNCWFSVQLSISHHLRAYKISQQNKFPQNNVVSVKKKKKTIRSVRYNEHVNLNERKEQMNMNEPTGDGKEANIVKVSSMWLRYV